MRVRRRVVIATRSMFTTHSIPVHVRHYSPVQSCKYKKKQQYLFGTLLVVSCYFEVVACRSTPVVKLKVAKNFRRGVVLTRSFRAVHTVHRALYCAVKTKLFYRCRNTCTRPHISYCTCTCNRNIIANVK